jgi:CsoR family transcriptional regulator, copper-sensing transcriptional repressor
MEPEHTPSRMKPHRRPLGDNGATSASAASASTAVSPAALVDGADDIREPVHEHGHEHAHQQRQGVVRRLKRAEGHLSAVRRMVEEGRDCPDILLQLAAVRAALDATAKVVLADHVESCLHDASHNGDTQAAWNDLRRALESFIR